MTDLFTTFQGTGALQGVRQFFVRLKGCGVACPICDVCDEQNSLKFDGDPLDIGFIISEALDAVGRNGWVHITGGEPCDNQQLTELSESILKNGMKIHLQTSGVREVPVEWDWLTVSPKTDPSRLVQKRGSEMVLINMAEIVADFGMLRAFYHGTRFLHYYLQPLWQDDPQKTVQMCDRANMLGMSWRLACQNHKFLGIQ